MSADRLIPGGAPRESELGTPRDDARAGAVLSVLAGTPLPAAAARIRVHPADLAAAVEVYQQAGSRALRETATASGWWQIYVEFPEWTTAEKAAADHLEPLLHRAAPHDAGPTWWFIRKYPSWRIRLHVPPHGHRAKASISAALDDLAAHGHILRWWTGIYEPETAAFGNATGMHIAHDLFHADSHAILGLHRLSEITVGRRELSVLLCSTLLRAAALEWYEQGDVWQRVCQERPLPDDIPPGQLQRLGDDLRQLMRADTETDGPLVGDDAPLALAADWVAAFRRAGQALGQAARAGGLDRGLRHIISYHVLFHWNRLGLPARRQSILAAAARTAILDPPATRDTTPHDQSGRCRENEPTSGARRGLD